MPTIKHILHPTDLSMAAKPAFEESIALARKFGATLHVLHVAPTFGDDPVRNAFKAAANEDEFYRAVQEEIEARMAAILKVHYTDGLTIQQVYERGHTPSEAIIEYASENSIDVIVMGTNGYKGLRRLVLGSVTANVAREAPCHVITVRNVTGVIDKQKPFDRILVPVDLEESSELQLEKAARLAKELDASMRVLHVVEPFPFPTWAMNSEMLNDLIPSHMEHIKERLDGMVKQMVGSEVPVEAVVDEGKAASCIVNQAEDYAADLIVMTPRSTGLMDRVPLGSVAERVMASSDHPVLLVHVPEVEASAAEDSATTSSTA